MRWPASWACRCCSGYGGDRPRAREPNDIGKIGIGAWLAAVANLMLAAAIAASRGAPLHPLWLLAYCFILGIAFLYYWPTLLALVSMAAPARVNSTMMGIVFMSLFVANNLIGWIGGFYERMTPLRFWALHGALSAAGGLLLLLFARRLGRVLRPE